MNQLRPKPSAAPTIRPATTADIPALLDIEEVCFDSDRLTRRSFNHMLTRAKASLYVAESVPGSISGYGLVLFHSGTALARLYSLAVRPEAVGTGIGTALVDHAEKVTRDNECVALRLEVRADNESAIALYERLGYRRLRALPHYYDDDGDGWRYEKRLHWIPGSNRTPVPYIHQTTEFTCGPASLMMAMAALREGSVPNPDEELRIWREATTIFMTSGHGGCGPHGLALAAHRRGFKARICVSEDGPLFLDTVRAPAKKLVLERVHAMLLADLVTAGMTVEISASTPADLEQALDAGWIPLLLVSSYRFNDEKVPHWVVVTGVDDRFILVHDPDMDEDLMKSDVDCTHVPIPRAAFTSMARFGRSRLQAVVYVAKGDAA
ncbi:MAG: GNAT family N-acetyltransferase/peptidase C39 family protein [Thalassobaculaceae bacterium]|nr:GNAT family N-acetyltransferase/peptidase C39 family protein [Thalassobaculaceae bacterium]